MLNRGICVTINVLVKGGDYIGKEIVGKKEVEDNGGEVKLISFVEGKSTTNIINRIHEIN